MKVECIDLYLPEGKFNSPLIAFTDDDRLVLWNIYKDWRNLCGRLNNIQARSINLPEGLSESAFCLEMGFLRMTKSISGANTSYDAYDNERHKRIQLKACSVLPDLTSFGPKSVWDEIYFADFFKDGLWNGSFDIYLIPNELIYNHKVNSKHTMRDQQKLNRRPRFSIFKELIQVHNIKPVKTCNLN